MSVCEARLPVQLAQVIGGARARLGGALSRFGGAKHLTVEDTIDELRRIQFDELNSQLTDDNRKSVLVTSDCRKNNYRIQTS